MDGPARRLHRASFCGGGDARRPLRARARRAAGHRSRRLSRPSPFFVRRRDIMVSSPDLLVILLGLELLSISGYVLAGLDRADPRSTESAVKAFLTGSLASAFLIFGLAFLYGAAGSLEIPSVRILLGAPASPAWTGLVGLGLVVVGFAFKVALVPFHMWAPDVYEGAPTPVTAFLTIVPKAAGFAVLLRLLGPLGSGPGAVRTALGAVAALTMVVASLAALRQKNIKRLLAYSSIAHSGTILLAVVAGDGPGLAFYLVVYLFMNVGRLRGGHGPGRKGRGPRTDLDSLAGAGYTIPMDRGPVLGVPACPSPDSRRPGDSWPSSSSSRRAVDRGFSGLVVIAVLASLVSVYYYFRVIVVMYMKPPAPARPKTSSRSRAIPPSTWSSSSASMRSFSSGSCRATFSTIIRRAF